MCAPSPSSRRGRLSCAQGDGLFLRVLMPAPATSEREQSAERRGTLASPGTPVTTTTQPGWRLCLHNPD